MEAGGEEKAERRQQVRGAGGEAGCESTAGLRSARDPAAEVEAAAACSTPVVPASPVKGWTGGDVALALAAAGSGVRGQLVGERGEGALSGASPSGIGAPVCMADVGRSVLAAHAMPVLAGAGEVATGSTRVAPGGGAGGCGGRLRGETRRLSRGMAGATGLVRVRRFLRLAQPPPPTSLAAAGEGGNDPVSGEGGYNPASGGGAPEMRLSCSGGSTGFESGGTGGGGGGGGPLLRWRVCDASGGGGGGPLFRWRVCDASGGGV